MNAADPTGGPIVALVDDDPSVCRSLARLLQAEGIGSVAYGSAEEFLSTPPPASCGCLVLDIQLGGISGIELLARLRSAGDRTPAIFITAHDEPKFREAAEAACCEAYLRKHESGRTIVGLIRSLCLRSAESRSAALLPRSAFPCEGSDAS